MSVLSRYFSICFLLFILRYSSANANELFPIVNTNVGPIQGLKAINEDYFMFMGIPYATINASNPFGAAIPQRPFGDVFFASDDSAICPQLDEFSNAITGTLDCLHLNVYVPNEINSNNRLPVMVWIHGGGFSIGFSGRFLQGPKFLVRHDVILVTLNYRLGPYGFMCLDTPEVPGNQGLKDQLIALRWIRNNIQYFGGDPNKITLFGESAGGASVDFHLTAPHEILVDKAILQSGTLLVPMYVEPQRDAAQRLAAGFGFNSNSPEEAIAYLATANPHIVILVALFSQMHFTPCIEKSFENVESFITKNWIEQADIPKVKNLSILIGYTDDEWLANYVNKPQSEFENLNVFQNTLSAVFNTNDPKFSGMEETVRQFYIGDESLGTHNKFKLANFDSDLIFNHPTYRSIARFLENNVGDIYHYVFSHTGERNFMRTRMNITEGGALHADELSYLFDTALFNEPPTQKDQLVIDRMTTMWTNFAKYGNPTPEVTELLQVEWKPITRDSKQYAMDINADLRLMTKPFHRRMAFWDLFLIKNSALLKLYSDSS